MTKELPKIGENDSVYMSRAAAVTDELVQYAVEIQEARFPGTKNPAILPAIIQAIATSYSTIRAVAKK